MPAASIYYDILTSVKSTVEALHLTFGGESVLVNLRKLPTIEETLDTPLPIIVVCPSEQPEQIEHISFEFIVSVVYRVELAIIAQGGRNFLTNLDTWLNWRQQIRRCFQQTPLAVAGDASQVYWARPDLEYTLDRNQLNQNYDYTGLAFLFTAAEQRNN